jgi:hypothetical protein
LEWEENKKMDHATIEKFRRHMGAGKTVKLKTPDGQEDEFYFKPLGVKYLPDFMYLALIMDTTPEQKKILSEMKKKVKKGEITQEELDAKIEEFDEINQAKVLEEEPSKLIIKLITQMVKNSYPDLDEETLDSFVMANFASLQGVLMELHEDMGTSTVDEKIMKKIEQVKAARRNAQIK